jgi:outer membrane lipopolysaccharide assembly protein LptE/RlpB
MKACALCVLALMFASCGYHLAGTANVLPKNVRTIAIPAFKNGTPRYKIAELVTTAVTREFISRAHYKIVAEPENADAVLSGSVVNFLAYPTTFDPQTGRAAGVQVIVYLALSLRDRTTNAVLFDRPHMEFRQTYEISVDPKTYFDESDVGMQRLSRDVARTVVSAVLENF